MSTTQFARTLFALFAGTALVAAVACSPPPDDDTGTDDDTATADTTDDTGGVDPFDSGEDSGMDEDTGVDSGNGGDTNETGTDDTGTDGGDASVACTFFPDNCPQGENCYIGQNGRQCSEYNSANKEGDSCSGAASSCDEGLVCDPTSQTNRTCLEKCDPTATSNACGSEETCLQLGNPNTGERYDLGVCISSCNYYPNDSCQASGEKCVPTQSGPACAPHGSGTAGSSCSIQNAPLDCDEGLICVQGTCNKICTDGSRCSSGETCAKTFQNSSLKTCRSN